jgi:ligand-binding sensor domain-containing protein
MIRGGVWIGTIAHLTRVVGDEWTTYDCEASGLWNPKKIIRSLDNKLHIIDNLSIYTYNIATGYGHVYLSIHNSLLPSNYVQDIAGDQYNRVWIATAGGLVRWPGNNVDVISSGQFAL